MVPTLQIVEDKILGIINGGILLGAFAVFYTLPWWPQTVKHLPAMRETRVRFLGQEDPLEKKMAMYSSTLAWKIPWTEEPDRLQSMGSQRFGSN